MTLKNILLENVLRQLSVPEPTIRQVEILKLLGNSPDSGYAKELFQLNTRMIFRGLLNFAVFQMRKGWVFPYWVNNQLDPSSPKFIPRAQNPFLINLTQRNWTALGTPHGFHEAIVDPRGLMTVLPREWSIDVWLSEGGEMYFPSNAGDVSQQFDCQAPRLTTSSVFHGINLSVEAFVYRFRKDIDGLFVRAGVNNSTRKEKSIMVCFALRPFNPEGMAPITSVSFISPRTAHVNGALAVIFRETPDKILCGNGESGDCAELMLKLDSTAGTDHPDPSKNHASCPVGLANAVAAFNVTLKPDASSSFHCFAPLADENDLKVTKNFYPWGTSHEQRVIDHGKIWSEEIAGSADFKIADDHVYQIFNAARAALLQLHDGEFVAPGPYLYHQFWFRDAVIMLRALDLLGFHERTRNTINSFYKRQRSNGFFEGPDGEWDSNGQVLWLVYQHFLLTDSRLWMRNIFPTMVKGADWIIEKRCTSKTGNGKNAGLMPPGLSAEHLGTVDQYYWDSFWSLAGLISAKNISAVLGKSLDEERYRIETEKFNNDILASLVLVERHLSKKLIPAAPGRGFDEGAIGSVCALYPLELFPPSFPNPANTVHELISRFVNEHGFFHSIIHSGYNPYLTFQLAHCLLWNDEINLAWKVADTIFLKMMEPYSLPEAIHPKGGGVMGDGYHGWAAAEIVMFIRDCYVNDRGTALEIGKGAAGRLILPDVSWKMENIPTKFGNLNYACIYESCAKAVIKFNNKYFTHTKPTNLIVHFPGIVERCVTLGKGSVLMLSQGNNVTALTLTSDATTVILDLKIASKG